MSGKVCGIGSFIMTMHLYMVTMQEFLATNKMINVHHPPNLPDLALCDLFFFPKIKILNI